MAYRKEQWIKSIKLLLAATSFLLLSSCHQDSAPWSESSLDTAPFLNNPQLEKWLSDKVPDEAVVLSLRIGSKGNDSIAPYAAPINLFSSPPCQNGKWSISSRAIATGSFPAFQIQTSLHCPSYTISWNSTITSQMRVARGWRDSTAVEFEE